MSFNGQTTTVSEDGERIIIIDFNEEDKERVSIDEYAQSNRVLIAEKDSIVYKTKRQTSIGDENGVLQESTMNNQGDNETILHQRADHHARAIGKKRLSLLERLSDEELFTIARKYMFLSNI